MNLRNENAIEIGYFNEQLTSRGESVKQQRAME